MNTIIDFIVMSSWTIPILLVLIGIVTGLVIEKIFIVRIRVLVTRTHNSLGNIIVNSLRGIILIWFITGGTYLGLISSPVSNSIITIAGEIVSVILIFSVTILTARIISGFVQGYLKNIKGSFKSTTMFTNITLVITYLLGVLVILQFLGISIAPILTALGVGGLAAALALQDTLSNLFSGIQLIASKKVKPGDYIKLSSGEEGYITDINWRNTTIRALANNMIIVPNSKLASSIVTNFCRPEQEMSVLIQVGVAYDSDLKEVERITKEVARSVMEEVDGAIPTFEPFLRYHTFDDFSINFTVILRVKEYVNQYVVKHEFIKKLHERYNEEGIEIPFPIRTLYVRQQETGNAGEFTKKLYK